jgi:hypothetical protein
VSSSSISVRRQSLLSFTYSDSSSVYVFICSCLLSISCRSSPFSLVLSPSRTRVFPFVFVFSLLIRSHLRSRNTWSLCLPIYLFSDRLCTYFVYQLVSLFPISDISYLLSYDLQLPLYNLRLSSLSSEIIFLHYSPSLWHRKIEQGYNNCTYTS